MEVQRPSQTSQAEAIQAPADGLDDRMARLLAGTGDDLPPLEADLPPLQETPVTAPPVEAPVAEAPPVEAPVASPVAEAPVAEAPAVEAPVAQAPVAEAPAVQAPIMLVPRPITNLTAGEKRDASMEAELYSILITMQHLEMAFVKGVVPNEEYERHCVQTVTQFKTLQKALASKVPDIKAFIVKHEIDCSLAEERLLGTGVAATALHSVGQAGGGGKETRAICSATEHFITVRDALSIGYASCSELLPLVQELQTSIVNISSLPQLPGLDRITNWLVSLNNMRATEKLSDDQVKQLILDVDLAFTSFKNFVDNMG